MSNPPENQTEHQNNETGPPINQHENEQNQEEPKNSDLLEIISCLSGNVIEYYDYNVYGYVSDAIGDVFFPSQSGNAALIESFTVFGCAFLMRPLGALFIGYLGDKYGPKYALEVSLFLMAIPTFTIGCLPTYDSIGWVAPFLLVVCRMLQGLSFGGQITSSFMFLLEKHNPTRTHWGLYGGFVLTSGYVGSLCGSLFGYTIRSTMSYEKLKRYGWRLPFLVGILLCFPGYYIKFYSIEHQPHQKRQQQSSVSQQMQVIDGCSSFGSNTSINPMKEAFRKENRRLFISIILMSMLGTAVFNLSFIWLPIYMDELVSSPVPQAFLINSICILFSLCLFTPISGILSDMYGRLPNMICGATGIAIFGCLVVYVISMNGNPYYVFFVQSILGCSFSLWTVSMWVWCMENLPSFIRLTTFAVAYNIASSLIGGFTPSFATIMVDAIGPISPALLYITLVLCALIGVVYAPFFKDVNYYQRNVTTDDGVEELGNANSYTIFPDDTLNSNDDNGSRREDSNMLLEQLLIQDTEKIIL